MRTSRDRLYLDIAARFAEQSTCVRRKVGCVLVDLNGDILGHGFNGVASGRDHCNEVKARQPIGSGRDLPDVSTKPEYYMPFKCEGAGSPSGQNLDACQALHAEQNAILRLKNYREVHTAYCTASPCVSCVKLFLGTPCQRIVFLEEYTHPAAKTYWEHAGRKWIHLPST
jgi:dCMP deaminase